MHQEENTSHIPSFSKSEKSGHRTHISCEVATAGKYDLIIPFGWWHKDHPIANSDEPQNWPFTERCCLGQVEDEGIGGMFEWDETVASTEEAQYVGRICRQEDPNQVLLDKIPQYYEDYHKLFLKIGRASCRERVSDYV